MIRFLAAVILLWAAAAFAFTIYSSPREETPPAARRASRRLS